MATELVQIVTELVKLIPSILWFFLIIFLLVLFYRPIRDDLLPNLSAFKAMGVELSFVVFLFNPFRQKYVKISSEILKTILSSIIDTPK